jgi:hypothetical protein
VLSFSLGLPLFTFLLTGVKNLAFIYDLHRMVRKEYELLRRSFIKFVRLLVERSLSRLPSLVIFWVLSDKQVILKNQFKDFLQSQLTFAITGLR